MSIINASMNLLFDNRTQVIVQAGVSIVLCAAMFVAWRTQKTYPGFGLWTLSKVPNALGWLLIGLRGLIPDWASVLLGNGFLLFSPLFSFEGIREFRGKPARDWLNYSLVLLLSGGFIYFTRVQPSVNARLVLISGYAAIIYTRCALELLFKTPRNQRPGYWFTAAMFGLYSIVLYLRLLTSASLPSLADPFAVDAWQNLLFLATNLAGIGWTFGLLMMTNQRLALELGAAEAEVREMAATDFLTGAYNRRAFSEFGQREMQRATRYAAPFALLIIDIDHFKAINDEYGHLNGDVMLCEVVKTLRANLRAVDILARWGGEEFAVLLPETDPAGCLRVAEKLRAAVADLRAPAEQRMMRATISLGCAVWNAQDETLDGALRRADQALYQAKQQGRNSAVMETIA